MDDYKAVASGIHGSGGNFVLSTKPTKTRKINRLSYKTEYESVFKLKEKLRVQRNIAVTLSACYILVDLIFKAFT